MSSKVQISNRAIGEISGNRITSLDDQSVEATLIRGLFDDLRKSTLESANWSFAIKRARLAKLQETPVFGYKNKHKLPSDCLREIAVTDDASFVYGDDTQIQYEKEGNNILSDSDAVYVIYVSDVTNTEIFSATFTDALVYRIAMDLAIPLTESAKRYKEIEQKYLYAVNNGETMDSMQSRSKKLKNRRLIDCR